MTPIDQEKAISRVLRAVERIRAGGMVIMVDDEDRENEGDLVIAAEFVRPEDINFMAKAARGLICLTLAPEMVDRLKLPMMGDSTKSIGSHGTAFTVSIEARHGVTTGISAFDRFHTIKVAIADHASPDDIVVPGHIFPLKARSGGVLERAGHTEGSVDLARLAGLKAAGVICEIMNDDGSMARLADLQKFSADHDIPIVAIADLITYRLMQESMVREMARRPVRTSHGVFEAVLFENVLDQTRHLALVKGADFEEDVVEVRVHSQRPLLDVFGDSESGGRFRLEYGLEQLRQSAKAVFVYLTRRDADLSFEEELAELEQALEEDTEAQADTQPAMDWRLHGTGAQILRALGVRKMRIHSSSYRNLKGLSGFGLEVVDTLIIEPQQELVH